MMVRQPDEKTIRAIRYAPGGNAMTETNEACARSAREFWASQDQILDRMQNAASGWFERRRAGTQAAIDATQRMCRTTTPAELLLEYQTWAMGAFERLMADVVACQGCGIAIGRVMAGPLAPDGEHDDSAAVSDLQAHIMVPSIPAAAAPRTAPVKPAPVRKAHGARATAT